jgi:hypothetical protein
MASGVRSRYHVAINSKGFMLRGAPSSPRYIKELAPSVANQLGPGDATLGDLRAGWAYWSQTDWSGGFQKLQFKDDASFRDGQAVDVFTKYGQVTLQNGFTSALSISGSHSYGAYGVHENTLLLGTIKAGTAKLFKITSANAISTVSGYAGISAINAISRYQNVSLVGLTRTSGSTLKTLAKWNGSALSGFRSTNQIVRAIKGIGIRAYFSEYVAALSGDQLLYTATLSAFTSAYNAGKNRKIKKIEDLNGTPYFFVEENPSLEMFRWDETNQKAYPVYKWENLTNYGVTRYLSFIKITGTSNGKSVAFAFNGAKLVQTFTDQIVDTSYDFSKPFVYDGNVQTKGAMWDGQIWAPGLYGKYATVQYTPFANFNNRAYGYAPTGTLLKVAYYDSTKYAVSGNVVSSEFGGNVGGVDKLLNTVTINHKTLATGQMIEVFRSIDGGSSFTSIGTSKFSTDGAVNKKVMYFPSGFVTKLWNYKAVLVGPGTTTPTLNDVTFEYRPSPDAKRRWSLSIDAGDDIKLLNQQDEQRDGKALISELWLEKEAKRTVKYEDVDSFEVSIVSAMAATATSAVVNNVRLMPPKGRMRVLSGNVAEEMIYTSANGNQVKGITRAQKGTVARAYTSAHKFDNYYTVLVTDVREQINDTDERTTESIAQVTLLEV